MCGEKRLAVTFLVTVLILAGTGKQGYDVGGVIAELVNVMRTPDYASEGVSETVSETAKIAIKSIQTLHRAISLLKLFDEIQAAIHNEGSE
jgi:lactate dehydrogenase-like 2-hydroxyacid dehydrogenase